MNTGADLASLVETYGEEGALAMQVRVPVALLFSLEPVCVHWKGNGVTCLHGILLLVVIHLRNPKWRD